MIRGLTRLLEGMLTLLMAGMILTVLWQVLTRYVLGQPSSFSEEAANFLLIWVGLLGASYAYHRAAHLGVDYFVSGFKGRRKLLSEFFIHLSVALFTTIALVWGGFHLVRIMLKYNQLSPALGLKMGHVYLALPLSGILILIFALNSCWRTWKDSSTPPAPPQSVQETR